MARGSLVLLVLGLIACTAGDHDSLSGPLGVDGQGTAPADSAVPQDEAFAVPGNGYRLYVASADAGGRVPLGPPIAPDPLPAGLSGAGPPADLDTGPPNLAGVLDTTATPPSDTDLIGHWTVLWFYPAASTPV